MLFLELELINKIYDQISYKDNKPSILVYSVAILDLIFHHGNSMLEENDYNTEGDYDIN